MKYKLLLGISFSLSLSGLSTQAAAPATAQGSLNFRTYAGDQRAGIRDGTAVPDGSFYPKRAEGPYNGYPGPEPGDDDAVPVDVREGYNMELVGYFYAPKTGKIQFAIATDDPGELWVSTDDNPANKKQVASEPTWNPKRAFGAETRRTRVNDGTEPADRLQNQSAFIDVVAGSLTGSNPSPRNSGAAIITPLPFVMTAIPISPMATNPSLASICPRLFLPRPLPRSCSNQPMLPFWRAGRPHFA